MKKLSSIGRLCGFAIALVLLRAPLVSAANNNYVLNFKGPQRTFSLILAVKMNEDRGGRESEEQSSELLPDGNTKNRKPDRVGGLPVSESAPPAQRQSFGSTTTDPDENQECGAVGGLPAPQACQYVTSPVSVSSSASARPITDQPAAGSARTIHKLPTGSTSVIAWLERLGSGVSVPVLYIHEDQLKTIARLFANLVAMEADEMYSNLPFTRCGTFVNDPDAADPDQVIRCSCGNQVCDSVANPTWRYGKYIVPAALCLTGIGSAVGYGLGSAGYAGMTDCGTGCLTSGLFCSALTTLLFSHTDFPNQFQVIFSFNSRKLNIPMLQQIRTMLQCTGGFDLVSYTINESGQTLTFNVRSSVDADQLKSWLDNSNLQLVDLAFYIKVSSIGAPISIESESESTPDEATGEVTPVEPNEEATSIIEPTEEATPIDSNEESIGDKLMDPDIAETRL